MRPQRFHQFACEALAKAPEVQAVEPWDRGDHTLGMRIVFTNGSQVWLGTTGALPPGVKSEDEDVPVLGEPPAHVPYPDVFDGGAVTPQRAQAYLAAALNNAGCEEIAEVYPYAETAQNPGFGVVFHSGAKGFCLFHHAARSGQGISGTPFSLPVAF
ncbi:hypothetical protein [Streptomyces sp. CC228A]|uniref:hypothetical protein n=1 Tax=Streptomyces sp. CC228A TaxID=2898186 RepID=UPI001F310CAB|nr:hypothetical protein [Streptomyces sp. CC228A]